MRKVLPFMLISIVPVVAICLTMVFPTLLTSRGQATYRPGDCLRTPIIEEKTLERWETPREADQLIMISEVGNKQYRFKEWGMRQRPVPEWYTSYGATDFKIFDNQGRWQPIPCPEQGPDPEPPAVSESAQAEPRQDLRQELYCNERGQCIAQ